MTLENTPSQATETQTSSTPDSSAAAPDKVSVAATPAPAAGAAPAEPAETPAWEPSFKYRVGKEEKEFDPFFKEFVKSQDHEKRLRELYEKADGLDVVKMSRDSYKKHLDEVTGKYTPIEKELKQLGLYFQNNDMDAAFKLLGLSEQKIIDFVATKLQYKQMSPEERSRVDAQRRLQDENYGRLSEVETLQQRLEQTEVQNLQFQMSVLQESPKFQDAASNFDSRIGKSGAFMEKLISVGDYLSQQMGKTVPPTEVFDRILREYGLEGVAAQPAIPPQAKPVVTTMPVDKPVIKNLGGSKTATPVKTKPKSLEDLKKMQREMSGASFEAGRR